MYFTSQHLSPDVDSCRTRWKSGIYLDITSRDFYKELGGTGLDWRPSDWIFSQFGSSQAQDRNKASGAFRNSSPTRLDTAAFSMTSSEESTPVGSTMMRLTDDGNEHVCLDTVATIIASGEEIRPFGLVTSTESALFRDHGKFYGGRHYQWAWTLR